MKFLKILSPFQPLFGLFIFTLPYIKNLLDSVPSIPGPLISVNKCFKCRYMQQIVRASSKCIMSTKTMLESVSQRSGCSKLPNAKFGSKGHQKISLRLSRVRFRWYLHQRKSHEPMQSNTTDVTLTWQAQSCGLIEISERTLCFEL